jgi:hypothetical protein
MDDVATCTLPSWDYESPANVIVSLIDVELQVNGITDFLPERYPPHSPLEKYCLLFCRVDEGGSMCVMQCPQFPFPSAIRKNTHAFFLRWMLLIDSASHPARD